MFAVAYLCIVQGTSSDQDNRFSDKNKRLMKTMKFAEAIAKKVICAILAVKFLLVYVDFILGLMYSEEACMKVVR